MMQLWRDKEYGEIKYDLDLRSVSDPQAKISSYWLRDAFEIVIDNAVRGEEERLLDRTHVCIGMLSQAIV